MFEILSKRFAVDTVRGTMLPLRDCTWEYLISNTLLENVPDDVRADLNICDDFFSAKKPDLKDNPPNLRNLTLNISHACNLQCEYCFEEWPNLRDGFKKDIHLMDEDIAFKAIDLLIEECGDASFLSVTFFGGEPLLNWSLIEKVVEYAERQGKKQGKEFSFSITTNGTLLDQEKQAYLIKNDFKVILSLDGCPETHDRYRKYRNGKGSGEIALQRARELKEKIEQASEWSSSALTVRGTFFRETLDFESSIYYLFNEGFNPISVENGVVREDNPIALRKQDVPEIMERYNTFVQRMTDDFIAGKPVFEHFHMVRILECIGLRHWRKRECGAGTGYMAVACDGSIYPCHKLVGLDKVKMGSTDTGIVQRDIGKMLWNTHIETKTTCQQCWARALCGGGCHADAYLINNCFDEPDPVSCELMKHRIRLGFYMIERLKADAPEGLQKLVPGITLDDQKPCRKNDICTTPHENDQMVVYHPGKKKVYVFDDFSVKVWEMCDGKNDLPQLAHNLAEILGQNTKKMLEDVRCTVTFFKQKSLVA